MARGDARTALIEGRHSHAAFLVSFAPGLAPAGAHGTLRWGTTITIDVPVDCAPGAEDPLLRDVDLLTLALDPRHARTYDLYALLGLQRRRFVATQAEIKAAYRARSLQYHPDKLQQAAVRGQTDAIFKCISFAYATLMDPGRRALYECVDPAAVDERVPGDEDVVAGDFASFSALFLPIFESNARWAKTKAAMPPLGGADAPRAAVESFYAYWRNFESTRKFDFLDEDESEHAENREHRRYLEKKNKAARLRRKTDDNARIGRLVDAAVRLDPRMAAFRAADKAAKDASRASKTAPGAKVSPAAAREAERKEALRKAEEEKTRLAAQMAEARRVRLAAEKAAAAEKTAFREALGERLYFADRRDVAAMTARATLVERVFGVVSDVAALNAELRARLSRGETLEVIAWMEDLLSGAARVEAIVESVASVDLSGSSVSQPEKAADDSNATAAASLPDTPAWSVTETDLLIRATKQHPGGLRDRWAAIEAWYNRHVGHLNASGAALPLRSASELIARAAALRDAPGHEAPASAVGEGENIAAAKRRDPRVDGHEPTIAEPPISDQASAPSAPWSAEEQRRLEAGLRAHPAAVGDERWDRIAADVGTRTRRECMARAREIAAALKSRGVRH